LPGIVKTVSGKGGQNQLLDLLKSLLSAKLKEAEEGGDESGMELANPEFVSEVAAAMEVIIGRDDRVRLTNTRDVPWRRVCALRITFPSGAVYRGSGFLIGRRAVATAGHCVYLHNQGGWARSVEVIPGANDAQRPFGSVMSSSLRSVAGWVSQRKPECDYGCIVLPAGAFNNHNLGAFGFAAFSAQDLKAQAAVMAGYPGDKPFAQLWGMARKIKRVNLKTLVYDIDSMGGQSGAPVYIKRNGMRYVVGIHNYGDQQGNSATRITPEVYRVLNLWSQI
jgi:V8-like Glu-specific endopeptidase